MEYIAHVSADGLKRKQSVATHLSEASEYAADFARKIGLEEAGRLLGIAHDLGKYSAKFQKYIKGATGVDFDRDDSDESEKLTRGSVDHSTAGAQFIHRELRRYLSEPTGLGNCHLIGNYRPVSF